LSNGRGKNSEITTNKPLNEISPQDKPEEIIKNPSRDIPEANNHSSEPVNLTPQNSKNQKESL